LWLINIELENIPKDSGERATVISVLWPFASVRGVSNELESNGESKTISFIIKSEFPELAREIFLSVEIDKGTLPKSKIEFVSNKGAFIEIEPEYESDIKLSDSVLEIIEFEISKGWYPELETGNKEKLKTSPVVELKFKLFEEKEIILRIFELITEADIV
jgi:hypothetical protein